MENTFMRLDFVPNPETRLAVSRAVADWLLKNAFMALDDDAVERLQAFKGTYMSLRIGGHVKDPVCPYLTEPAYSTVSFDAEVADDEVYEDPDGSRWCKNRMTSTVSWPSWGSSTPALARMRLDVCAAATELSARFNEEFECVTFWTLVSTREGREREVLQRQRDMTHHKVHNTIVEAIASTCRYMKVGSERNVRVKDARSDLLVGTYVIDTQGKKYDARLTQGSDGFHLWFQRTK